ncbi:MAG: hypothetical protein J7L15_07460 [Clostridiales bacterium]|nr:hypothetical protein [Clostridiales bacterium]
MSKKKREYEVVSEFRDLARQIVEKYDSVFSGINVDKLQCVKIVNKERPEKKDKLYENLAVKMPVLLDCPYSWYITVFSSDWDAYDSTHKLALISQILCSIPTDEEGEGKLNTFDSKDFKLLQRSFGTIDYMDDPNIPNILEEDMNWIQR